MKYIWVLLPVGLVIAAAWWFFHTSSIVIENQPIEDTITIQKLVMRSGGFVVIEAATVGYTGEGLARTDYIRPGSYSNFRIPYNLENLIAGGSQFFYPMRALLYRDTDGNKRLDEHDVLLRDILGYPNKSSFRLENSQ